MLNHDRIIQLGIWCAVFAITSGSAMAQAPSGADEISCRRFAQAFYDWYAPFTQKRLNGPAWDVALQHNADAFAPDLLQALKLDTEAQAQANGEIVGIDFDPFVGSQDPAGRYEARRVTLQENRCSVEVWRASPNDTAAKSEKPEALAELIRDKGHWRFSNFRYPDVNANLVSRLGATGQGSA